MKKITAIFTSVIIMITLSGCSLGLDITENIRPPKAGAEKSQIQAALEAYAGTEIKLVYPSKGDYRSAITTKDVNGDGVPEAFAFYSTKADDKSNVIHLNFIRKTESGWVSVSDIKKNVAGVESVEFIDFGDGSLKGIVKWQGFTSLEGLISMLEAEQGTLLEVYCHPCSSYIICDLADSGSEDIIEIYCNPTEKTATASRIVYGENGFSAESTCRLDGSVTSYEEPVLSKLKNGTAAIFTDAVKSTGYITEVLTLRDGKIASSFTAGMKAENTSTFRKSTVVCEDINNDGCYEIPLAEPLPILGGETEQSYINVWNTFDGLSLTPIAYSIINYTDGYTLFVSKEAVGNFTVSRDTDLRLRVFYRWEAEEQKTAEEIFRIRVFTTSDWEKKNGVPEGYFEAARNDDSVFAIRLGNSALTPSVSYLRENFRLIVSKEATH